MPMFETDLPCPICGRVLTDVNGMLECQRYEDPTTPAPHFTYIPGDEGNYFNFEAYFEMISEKRRILKLANGAKIVTQLQSV